jgi:predicted TPR repeat methyltransferase
MSAQATRIPDPEQAVRQAKASYAQGKMDDAFTILSQALEAEPENRLLLRTRAHLSIAQKNIVQAERDLDRLIALYPGDAESLDDRGVLHQWQKNYLEAASCHLRAVEIELNENSLLNLAIALNHLGQREQAAKLYQDILSFNPNNTRALINLGVICDERNDHLESLKHLHHAAELGDQSFELYMALGNTYRHQEQRIQAADWYRKAILLRPDNTSAAFMLAMMEGRNPEAPPAEHVADLFDSYADGFEKSLLGDLKYRGPQLLFNAVANDLAELKKQFHKLIGIDLGAGTGLFGKLVRPFLEISIGVDLSEKMLAKAQEQKIYDRILCADIVDGLKEFPDSYFHLIAAADVFVYLGALESSFNEIARALRSHGLFAFTTEAMTAAEKGDFTLRDTGRYAHDKQYIRKLSDQYGFDIVVLKQDWSRYNKDKPLEGFVVVLRKR